MEAVRSSLDRGRCLVLISPRPTMQEVASRLDGILVDIATDHPLAAAFWKENFLHRVRSVFVHCS